MAETKKSYAAALGGQGRKVINVYPADNCRPDNIGKKVEKKSKVPKRGKRSKANAIARTYTHPFAHPALSFLKEEVKQDDDKQEDWIVPARTSPARYARTMILKQPSMLATARAMLSNGKHEYAFRLSTNSILTSISSNVSAGGTPFSPLSVPEWSGIIDALFDEYRVDKVVVHYNPLIESGQSVFFATGSYYVASDYTSSPTPTSVAEVMNYADGESVHAMVQSASAYFIYSAVQHTHVSVMPRIVAIVGSDASAEWLGTADAWPGSQIYFANTTGANGVPTFYRTPVYYVRCRMRR